MTLDELVRRRDLEGADLWPLFEEHPDLWDELVDWMQDTPPRRAIQTMTNEFLGAVVDYNEAAVPYELVTEMVRAQ